MHEAKARREAVQLQVSGSRGAINATFRPNPISRRFLTALPRRSTACESYGGNASSFFLFSTSQLDTGEHGALGDMAIQISCPRPSTSARATSSNIYLASSLPLAPVAARCLFRYASLGCFA